jgi:hypothetical protein
LKVRHNMYSPFFQNVLLQFNCISAIRLCKCFQPTYIDDARAFAAGRF